MAERYLADERGGNCVLSCHLTFDQARHRLIDGLLILAREPDVDVSDDRIHEILTAVVSPNDLEDLIEKLRKVKDTDGPSEKASSSSAGGNDHWESWVSEAAAPTVDIPPVSEVIHVDVTNDDTDSAVIVIDDDVCMQDPDAEDITYAEVDISMYPCKVYPFCPESRPAIDKDKSHVHITDECCQSW